MPIYDIASIYRDLLFGSNTDPEQLEQYIKMVGLVIAFNVVLLIPDFPEAAQRVPAIIQNLLHPVVMPNVDALKHLLSK